MSLAGDSPTPSASGAEKAPGKKQAAHITFQFCKECSNMLYPREDHDSRNLMFACRTCTFTEPAASACVFRNIMSNTVGETEGVTQDVASDPTLPRSNKQCPHCSETEAVFFQSQQRSANTGMKLFFVCCACGTVFQ